MEAKFLNYYTSVQKHSDSDGTQNGCSMLLLLPQRQKGFTTNSITGRETLKRSDKNFDWILFIEKAVWKIYIWIRKDDWKKILRSWSDILMIRIKVYDLFITDPIWSKFWCIPVEEVVFFISHWMPSHFSIFINSPSWCVLLGIKIAKRIFNIHCIVSFGVGSLQISFVQIHLVAIHPHWSSTCSFNSVELKIV